MHQLTNDSFIYWGKKTPQKWWKRASYFSSNSCLDFMIENENNLTEQVYAGCKTQAHFLSCKWVSDSGGGRGARRHFHIWRVRAHKSEREGSSRSIKLAWLPVEGGEIESASNRVRSGKERMLGQEASWETPADPRA